jgi:iron(III) transport system ATP-binding protein
MRHPTMTSLRLDNLTKSYDGVTNVLKDVSLTVEAGELFFLLGPSGCGKSTLLRIIGGFLTPSQGQVYFGEADVTAAAPEKRETAMVFQNYALWPHMTVAENVGFGLDIRQVTGADRQRRVVEALEMVDMVAFADRPIPALSGGQQQRVAVARAVVVRPEILLLDEPLSNLDARLRVSMRAEIRRICQAAGVTAIYVTHDQKEALSMADRIAVLHDGVLQQIGTPMDVYRRPANRFVADFIGEGNFIDGRLVSCDNGEGVIETTLGTLTSAAVHPDAAPGNDVVSVIRPECLRPGTNDEMNRFSAVIRDSVFLGEVSQWNVEAGGLLLQAFEQNPPARAIGDALELAVAPQDVVVLPC